MEMMVMVIQVMGRCGVEEVEATIAARTEDLTHQKIRDWNESRPGLKMNQ